MTRHAMRLMLLAALTGWMAAQDPALAAAIEEGSCNTLAPADRASGTSGIASLRDSAIRGDAQAQYDLAVALDCGRSIKRDRSLALEWLRKSADQGHVSAQSALGWKYMTGNGARRDDEAAFDWLRRAAERGNTSAQNNLGVLYAQGRGVAANPAEAEKWFRLAAEKGAPDAQRNLNALLAGRNRDAQKRPGTSRPSI